MEWNNIACLGWISYFYNFFCQNYPGKILQFSQLQKLCPNWFSNVEFFLTHKHPEIHVCYVKPLIFKHIYIYLACENAY